MTDTWEQPFRADLLRATPDVVLEPASSIKLEESPPYLVKGWIYPGDFSVWFGPSGSGKTFAALWVAYCIATGRSTCFGRRVRPGRVALFALEGASGLPKRVTALQRAHGPAENLLVHRKPLVLFEQPSVLLEVIAGVQNCGAELVIIDTLSRTMSGGNENNSDDMTHMLSCFEKIQVETGAHVLVVHHSGKSEAMGARGHSSLRAAADVEIQVAKSGGAHSLTVTKGRDEADGQTYGFKLNVVELGTDEDGDPITTCVIEEEENGAGPSSRKIKLTPSQRLAFDCFREAIVEYGQNDISVLKPGIVATRRQNWLEVANKRGLGPTMQATDRAITRATPPLVTAKLIAVSTPWYWLQK